MYCTCIKFSMNVLAGTSFPESKVVTIYMCIYVYTNLEFSMYRNVYCIFIVLRKFHMQFRTKNRSVGEISLENYNKLVVGVFYFNVIHI